jgi:hypothetical protein
MATSSFTALEKATRDAEVTEQASRDVAFGAALQAERNLARDARYAARKIDRENDSAHVG